MGKRTEFAYLLSWLDEETMRRAWAQFKADNEWIKVKQVTNSEHGDLVGEIQDRLLVPTSYGPAAMAKSEKTLSSKKPNGD
jgi:hypothetical protein